MQTTIGKTNYKHLQLLTLNIFMKQNKSPVEFLSFAGLQWFWGMFNKTCIKIVSLVFYLYLYKLCGKAIVFSTEKWKFLFIFYSWKNANQNQKIKIEMYAKLFKISIWQNCNLFTVCFFFMEKRKRDIFRIVQVAQ